MAHHIRFNPDLHTESALSEQLAALDGSIITGSLGRAALLNTLGRPTAEFEQRGENILRKLGILARDIDIPPALNSGTRSAGVYPVDPCAIVPQGCNLVQLSDGSLEVSTSCFEIEGDPLPPEAFRPVTSKILGADVLTLPPLTLYALTRSFGPERIKDTIGTDLMLEAHRELGSNGLQVDDYRQLLSLGEERCRSPRVFLKHRVSNLPWHRFTR